MVTCVMNGPRFRALPPLTVPFHLAGGDGMLVFLVPNVDEP